MGKVGKSTDGLMRHIRKYHHISISGSVDKKNLIGIGYYHGYKGYKFYQISNNPFDSINKFSQIMAIADYDRQVKADLYPLVMRFENVIKNLVVNRAVKGIEPSFENVFNKKLTYYKSISRSNRRAYYNAVNKRLKLKQMIDGSIANEYRNSNRLITHYINSSHSVPLWAIFEIISLGNVGQFMWTLGLEDRIEIAKFFNVYDPQYDPQANFIRQTIYIIRDLRNALAHNHIIFDCRFKNRNVGISRNIKETMRNKIGLNNIRFNELFDYLALLIIILKESGVTNKELMEYITSFQKSTNQFYESTKATGLSYAIYNRIIGEDFINKLAKLKKYVGN